MFEEISLEEIYQNETGKKWWVNPVCHGELGFFSDDYMKWLETKVSDGRRAIEAMEKALELIFEYGQIDGAHHKAWVIDQVVRILCGKEYEKEIADYKNGEDGADTYEWNIGIAP